ncbi:MAG: undecaprenyl-diphosphate phosphatase, partial [Microgenomates group bacterium]
ILIKDSLLIGVTQALAIIPGISRSGATIFAGTSMGVKREEAAKFSFLLSIPAIVGANVLQFINHTAVVIDGAGFYLAGFLAAFFSGVLTINLVLKFLLSRKFRVFSLYCLIVGILVLIL